MIQIVSARPLPGCRLEVAFNDGPGGLFPVETDCRGGVFLKLLDSPILNAVTLNPDFGCEEWPGGVDLCPAAMLEAMFGRKIAAGEDKPIHLLKV